MSLPKKNNFFIKNPKKSLIVKIIFTSVAIDVTTANNYRAIAGHFFYQQL